MLENQNEIDLLIENEVSKLITEEEFNQDDDNDLDKLNELDGEPITFSGENNYQDKEVDMENNNNNCNNNFEIDDNSKWRKVFGKRTSYWIEHFYKKTNSKFN
jgi:hypothetical protein